jgi:hypothetical protein
MTIQKSSLRAFAIDSEFFHRAFANPCNTKGAAGAVRTIGN